MTLVFGQGDPVHNIMVPTVRRRSLRASCRAPEGPAQALDSKNHTRTYSIEQFLLPNADHIGGS